MQPPPPRSDPASGGSLGTRLDRVCEAFEAEWRGVLRNEGPRPSIEAYLANITAEEQWAFLRELLLTDQQCRELAGEVVDLAEYEQRFPQFASLIPSLFRRPAAPDRIRDYRLLEVIGRGGMGVVYKARHLRLGKVRAIKVLARQLLDNREALERFRLEVENCGRLDHPNIVQALDAGQENDLHYLVMEYVSGWNLTRIVDTFRQRGRQLPVEAACELVRQACLGLQHAYEHFLVHRDLKPSNLMLSDGGLVKILDLGLARFVAEQQPGTRLTLSSGPMGTCDYMAPEQWVDASSVDVRADLYSLGCTLYYLLTGQVPFGGEEYRTLHQKQLAHQQAPIPRLRDERPDVPAAVQAVLDLLMAKAPQERYRDPAEAVAALTPLANPEAIAEVLLVMQQPSAVRDRPTQSSSAADTNRSARKRRRRGRSWLQPWQRRVIKGLVAGAILILAAYLGWRLVPRTPPPTPLAAETIRELALLPGLNGPWWFDEMPWYTPATRAALAQALADQDPSAIVGDDRQGYLRPNVVAAHRWVADSVGRCRHLLTPRQQRLLGHLQTISSEQLEDQDLEPRLRACYEEFLAPPTGEDTPEDLYTRGLLEHKLAELRHDPALARQALHCYDAALEAYEEADCDEVGLALLCEADSARLCATVLGEYDRALDRLETLITEETPLLFQVDTLVAYSQAGRAAGDYDKDENLRLARRLLDGSALISRNHPLWAHVCERLAWSLMDQWDVERAYAEFEAAYSIRFINAQEDPSAAIYVFHNLHGKAMAQRYLGKVESARSEFDEVLAKIEAEREQVPEASRRPGLQRFARDLRERWSNALERRADCELFEGAASDPASVDLGLASADYERAAEAAEDPGARVVQACKRCLALALQDETATAREEFQAETVSRRPVIGASAERVRVLRQLTAAVLAQQEAGLPAGTAGLRQFLVQFDRDPYPSDRLRREILELQLFAAELLVASDLKTPAGRTAARQDVAYLEQLLRKFEELLNAHATRETMLPFLRRYYDLALAALGDSDADRAARLILASRGPEEKPDPDAVRILFHLHDTEGLAVALLPDGTSTAFRLPQLGRKPLKQKPRGQANGPVWTLPSPLQTLITAQRTAGRQIECLWSDLRCWPDSQRRLALTAAEFPFAELRGQVAVR